MSRWPELIVRRRRGVFLAWLLVALVLLPQAPRIAEQLEVGSAAMDHSEAEQVERRLAESFQAPFARSLVLVVTGVPALDQDAGIDILVDVVDHLRGIEGVSGVLSYLDSTDPAFLGNDGTFVVVGLAPGGERGQDRVLHLRRSTQPLEDSLRRSHPDAALSWTGDDAFDFDVRMTSNRDAATAERRVVPVVLALLFVVFGGLVAALLPVAIGGLGVGLSLGAAVLIAMVWPMTILLQNIVTMIGLGIGIDYSLLMINRFREELRLGADPESAAARTLATAGTTILYSGTTVAIGFAGLLAVPATELRSIATGGLLVVVIVTALATLLLPGLLAWLGTRINALGLATAGIGASPSTTWRRWGEKVVAHPWRVLLAFTFPLVILAAQARLASTDIPSGNWLPEDTESTRGAEALQRFGQSGLIQTLRVLVDFPDGVKADSLEGWQTVLSLGQAWSSDPRVARVISLPRILGFESAQDGQRSLIEARLKDAYISSDGGMALIEIVPAEGVSTGDLTRYARELRTTDPRTGARLLVGGLPALNADYQDAIGGSLVRVIAFILSGSLLALFLAFRSVLLAVKALALNLLSVAAAMGLAVLVFQQGHGAEWMGVTEPLDGLFPAVPVIVFCVVFGLSMDYEVFLLARVAELRRDGRTDDDAIVEALARTGRVISGAAGVMIVVFAGFSLGDFIIIKILGFTLAAAVLIDATLVRMAMGPALLKLGSRWNWWPGRR